MKKLILLVAAAVLVGPSFGATGARWFRLTLKQKYTWSAASKGSLRISEWFFYDGQGEPLSLSISSVSGMTPAEMPAGTSMLSTPYTGAAGSDALIFNGKYSGEQAGQLSITGLPTQDKDPYCLISVGKPETWSTVTVHLNDGLPLISGYQLYVGYQNWSGVEHSPARWTVEASYDGINWFVADDRSTADVTAPTGANQPYNGGVPFAFTTPSMNTLVVDSADTDALKGPYGDDVAVVKTGTGAVRAFGDLGNSAVRIREGELAFEGAATAATGVVTVGKDAELSVSGTPTFGTIVNGSEVTVDEGAEAVFNPPPGRTVSVTGGGIVGAGAIVKTGGGTLEMDGDNGLTGEVKVEAGTLHLGRIAATSAKWFRFAIKRKYKTTSVAAALALREFALFDADTVEQNSGYAVCAASVAASDMLPGTIKVDNPYTVLSDADLRKLTDGNLTTKMEIVGIAKTEDGYPAISPDDPSTWITFYFHLKDEARPIVGYNLRLGEQNWNGVERSPSRWTLEASHDGETWFVVDDQSGKDVTSPGGPNRWFNYDSANPDAVTPFPLVVESAATAALPTAARLSVAYGAVVKIADASQVGRLLVDLAAGGGTIDGFNPAANGTLDLVGGKIGFDAATELPLTLANVVNAENLGNWKVTVGGDLKNLRFKIVSGKPMVDPIRGLLMIVR